MKNVLKINADWGNSNFTNFHGIEHATNLEVLTGEFINPVVELRPIKKSQKLKELNIELANQQSLRDLKKLNSLESIHIYGRGFDSDEDEANSDPLYTQALLTDITALSNLKNLKNINISAEGTMPTITLKKGTTSYELFDPILPSSQFERYEITYYSSLDSADYSFKSNEWLKWENLTGEEKFLTFEWHVGDNNGNNFLFDGIGQIPIRWK